MDLEFDLDKLRESLMDFYYDHKKKIISGIAVFFSISAFLFITHRINYSSRIESSNKLIEYINNENEDFLKKNHKKGYAIISDFVKNKKNPSESKFDEFAKLDEFVFNNLFYFAKRLCFGSKDDFYMFYESNKNPWSKLILLCDIFYGDKDSSCIKQKDDYLISYLIGKGMKC